MIFGKFTERAQLVLVEAQKESQYFKHGYIGTEHVLLGVLREGGYAKQLLYSNGVTVEKVRKVIEDYLGFGDIDISVGEMLLNPKTKRLFDDSLIKARIYDHNCINPEHILLALIDDTEGVAYTIFTNLKLNLNLIKNEISNYLYEKRLD
ncbi:ATP-dependent Clp protease ATP-binding subunit ClpC, partial [Clostridium perfringens]